MSATRKDSGLVRPALSRNGTLTVPGQRFETVDELDDLDKRYRKVSTAVAGGSVHRKISARPSSSPSQVRRKSVISRSNSQGNLNPAFDTIDELDVLDQQFRRPSFSRSPSKAPSLVGQKAEPETPDNKEGYLIKTFAKSSNLLLGLAILFFLTTEIMVSVYLWEIYREPPPEVCHSEACITAGKLLIGSLNLNIDPCVDFYAHACGRFQAKEPFGNRYQDIEDLIDDEVVIRMHGILLELRSSRQANSDYQNKAVDFYTQCEKMNHTQFRQALVHKLQDLMWPVLLKEGSYEAEPENLLRDLHMHGISVFFKVSRWPDSKRPTEPFWVLKEAHLPVPRDLYRSNEDLQLYEQFIDETVKSLRKAINLDGENDTVLTELLATDSRAVAGIEASLASESLQNFSQKNVTSTMSGDTKIVLQNQEYFQELDDLLNVTSARVQAVYLGWRILFRYMDLIENEPDLWAIVQKFWSHAGIQSEVRWKKCTRWSIRAVPDGGLTMYGHKYYSKDKNAKINAMLDKITQVADELVDSQAWMDGKDKDAAKEKIAKIERQLPYSEELFAKNLTSRLYKGATITNSSFFTTVRHFQNLRQNFFLNEMLDTPVKYKNLMKFGFGSDYQLQDEDIGLAGIYPRSLVTPFHDTTYPGFVQYALLGYQYARILVHVIDHDWFILNKTGVEANGPEKKTLDAYRRRLGYLLETYKNISVRLGISMDEDTLYEDSADHAALRLVYRAYQKTIKDSNDKLLPGLTYQTRTFYQMFFLMFSQQFCRNRESLRKTDRGSVGFSDPKVRLVAMAENSNEFQVTFQCNASAAGLQLFDVPDPPRKLRYQKGITAERIDEWYHWFDRKPGLPTWKKAW